MCRIKVDVLGDGDLSIEYRGDRIVFEKVEVLDRMVGRNSLSAADVFEIRSRSRGGATTKELARQFGVTTRTIFRIKAIRGREEYDAE